MGAGVKAFPPDVAAPRRGRQRLRRGERVSRAAMSSPSRIAVIDIGSNTANVAVYAAPLRGALDRVADRSEPLRLMRRLGSDGMLAPSAIERLLETLRSFRDFAGDHGAEKVIVLATSAVRDAKNADAVARLAREELGLAFRVIDGQEEGALAGIATSCLLGVREGVVVDLGGGSLQLVELRAGSVGRTVSLPLGALRLTDKFQFGDAVSAEAVLALRAHVDEALAGVNWLRAAAGPLVGVGGTLRALAKVDRRARGWPIAHGHGYLLGRDAIERTWEHASRVDAGRRRDIPGLAGHRVDTIAAGACTVLRVMAARRTHEVRMNSYGVREGAALRAFLGADQPVVADPLGIELAARFPTVGGVDGNEGARARSALDEVLVRADRDVRNEVGTPGSDRRTGLELAAWLCAAGVHESARLVSMDGSKDRPVHGASHEAVLVAADLLREAPAYGLPPGVHRRMKGLLREACGR